MRASTGKVKVYKGVEDLTKADSLAKEGKLFYTLKYEMRLSCYHWNGCNYDLPSGLGGIRVTMYDFYEEQIEDDSQEQAQLVTNPSLG